MDKEKWEKKTLGEICDIKRGGSPRPIKKFITNDPNGINWIKIGDANDTKYISSCKEKISPEGMKKSRFVHKGDFLLSNSMSFGRPYILNVDGCIHDGWLVLENPTAFDTSFLYYLLSSSKMYEKFAQKAQGAVVNNLNIDRVANVEVAFPTKEEQHSIARELDSVQAMIDGYRQQIADLDTLAQSIFLDTFGDIVNGKKWDVVSLFDITSSINYGTSLPAVDGGKYKYIRMGNITDNGYLDLDDLKYIDVPEAEIDKCIVRKGDILFNRTNSRDKVGKTTCFMEDSPMVIAGYIIRVRIDETKALPLYVARAFNTPEMKRHLKKIARGSVGQANINSKELANINLSLPPLELQRTFVAKLESIEKQKEQLRRQQADAETLMAERMQYYFS